VIISLLWVYISPSSNNVANAGGFQFPWELEVDVLAHLSWTQSMKNFLSESTLVSWFLCILDS
jgi:hypothetical protein